MGDAAIGRVAVKLTADPSGLQAGINQAVAALNRLEQAASGIQRSTGAILALKGVEVVGKVFSSLGQTAAGIASQFYSMGKAQAEVVDSQLAMAKRVGMTFSELSGLAYAGQLANVSIETIVASSNRADVALTGLEAGAKGSVAAFARLGLAASDFAGKSSAERFSMIAAAISKLPTSVARSAAAMKIFGRGGAALIPLFSEGADYIAKMSEEAKRLGLSLNTLQAQSVDDMGDAFLRAQSAIGGIVRQVVATLSPAIKNIADEFTAFVAKVGGANIGARIGAGILEGARYLADMTDLFIQKVSSVWQQGAQISIQWSAVWDRAGRVIGVFQMAAGLLGTAMGAVILGIGAIAELLFRASEALFRVPTLGYENSVSRQTKMAGDVIQGFNKGLMKGMDDAIGNMSAGFDKTFGDPKKYTAIERPTRIALERGINSAFRNAKTPDIKVKEDKRAMEDAAKSSAQILADSMATSLKAIKGIDAYSEEGLAAIARHYRGDTGSDVQVQQLQELRGIREAVEDPGDDPVVGMEG